MNSFDYIEALVFAGMFQFASQGVPLLGHLTWHYVGSVFVPKKVRYLPVFSDPNSSAYIPSTKQFRHHFSPLMSLGSLKLLIASIVFYNVMRHYAEIAGDSMFGVIMGLINTVTIALVTWILVAHLVGLKRLYIQRCFDIVRVYFSFVTGMYLAIHACWS
ncbi:membrane hypothetical protein [Vibrio jasicida]|jgi:hypothetical protein|uniref:Uncharacterized protein n=1 Tax=Vibrio jasicida TaxID=766224 RepID=A0AAU9QTT5_9VIBR|nr:membrane hypothetical protein [Vibrio jasicida]CAH1601866.1 membrane hypothetical protein [Vibrio jasicida]